MDIGAYEDYVRRRLSRDSLLREVLLEGFLLDTFKSGAIQCFRNYVPDLEADFLRECNEDAEDEAALKAEWRADRT
jgi:hypothetical protein